MTKQPIDEDRNFDDLAERFKRNIYGGLKGEIRLAILNRDFAGHVDIISVEQSAPFKQLRILDAGGGQGQFSLSFAEAGHSVVICDISAEMLKLAEAQVVAKNLQPRVQLVQSAIQDLDKHLSASECQFDLVLCHAVLEWVVNPREVLCHLNSYMKPKGFLSLTFYNLHSLIYKNLLRTNFKKIQQQDFGGARGSLTPINPLYPEQVFAWLDQLPLTQVTVSGIRVFHDYIFNEAQRERDPQSLIELELELSRKQPYQMLGRYIHVLVQKSS